MSKAFLTLKDAETVADGLSPAVIQQMREWASDCQWLDGEDLDEYTDGQIVQGISKHYAGGVEQFVKDSQPAKLTGFNALVPTVTIPVEAYEAMIGVIRKTVENCERCKGTGIIKRCLPLGSPLLPEIACERCRDARVLLGLKEKGEI